MKLIDKMSHLIDCIIAYLRKVQAALKACKQCIEALNGLRRPPEEASA